MKRRGAGGVEEEEVVKSRHWATQVSIVLARPPGSDQLCDLGASRAVARAARALARISDVTWSHKGSRE